MNAADVLAVKWSHADDCAAWNEREELDLVGNIIYTADACTCGLAEFRKAAAESEQGIARLPDGTLWALKAFPSGAAYRLVPLSAEAGDTPLDQRCGWKPTPKGVHQCWLLKGHEGFHVASAMAAEAGDTDG